MVLRVPHLPGVLTLVAPPAHTQVARLINALDAATESAAAEVFRLTAALEASEADRRDLLSQVGARLLGTFWSGPLNGAGFPRALEEDAQ